MTRAPTQISRPRNHVWILLPQRSSQWNKRKYMLEKEKKKCWKEKKCHQQPRNKNSRKAESRWDWTSEHIKAKEASFPDTIIGYNSCQGCPKKYPTLELTEEKKKKRATTGERAVSKVTHTILDLTCQKLSPSPFALHQGREQAQLRIGSTRTNESMLASEKEGSGKWSVSGLLQQTQN